MLSLFITSLLISSPYSFEIKTGLVVEPTLGYFFQDSGNKSRATAGARFSYLLPDVTDAFMTGELQVLSATEFRRPTNASGGTDLKTDTNYYLEASVLFAEIYNPFAFRFAAGGGIEKGDKVSGDIYYRGGLGRYFSRNFGIFLDASGRVIFRSAKTALPVEVGPSLQIIF